MSNLAKLQELCDKKNDLVANAETLINGDDEFTPDKESQFDEMHADIEAITAEMAELEAADKRREERLAKLMAHREQLDALDLTPAVQRVRNGGGGGGQIIGADSPDLWTPSKRLEAQADVLKAWGRGGRLAIENSADLRQQFAGSGLGWDTDEGGLMVSLRNQAPRSVQSIINAQTTVPAEGGYTIPEGFVNNLEIAMLEFGGMRQVSSIIRTATGNDLPWPTTNDTANKGVLLAESVQDAELDVVFGQVMFGAYKYTSRIVRVSVELMQDSAFDMGAFLGRTLGERLARIENEAATIGTGTTEPTGIIPSSGTGPDLAANNAIAYDDLLNLKHSVDPAYRSRATWMFNDTTLLSIKKLVDLEGRPLWQSGIAVGEPDRIDGDPYVINQDCPDNATDVLGAIVYGALWKFQIREALGVTLTRLVERYADFHEVAFVAIMRFDSNMLDAGTTPVKHSVSPT